MKVGGKSYAWCVWGENPCVPMGVCHAYECHQSCAVSQLGSNTQTGSLKSILQFWGWMLEVGEKGEAGRTGNPLRVKTVTDMRRENTSASGPADGFKLLNQNQQHMSRNYQMRQ